MTRSGTAALVITAATLLAAAFVPVARSAPPATLVALKNGMRIVLAPDSGATAVDLAVWYPVGIEAEGRDALGMRHLIERLMYRGSANVPDGEHTKRLVAEGGTPNTQLQLDYSCFYQTLPAEALGLALTLEADRMAGLKTAPAAFEESRRSTIADVRGRANRPVVTRALARLGATVYRGLPYERPAEGDEAVLARATPAAVEAWRKAHYGPRNAVLTVVGRFEPAATLAMVKRLFEPLSGGAALPAPGRSRAQQVAGARLWERDSGMPARLLLVGWRLPGTTDPDAAALELLAGVLGSPEASGFTPTMTQRWASASFAQCGLDRHRDASMLWTVTALAPVADSAAVELQVTDFVGALRRDLVAATDLDRVRARLLGSELLRSQQVRTRAQLLGDALCETGDVGAAERRLADLQRVTPADVQRVATRVLTESACSIVWLVPAGGR
jgi:zinc protease